MQRLLVTFLTALALVPFDATAERLVVWKPLAPDDGALVLYVPGLTDRPVALSRRSTDGLGFQERARWTGGTRAFAHLVLTRLNPIESYFLHADDLPSIRERIHAWYPDQDLSLGATGEGANAIGPIEHQRYSKGGPYHCVFFRQRGGPLPHEALLAGKGLGTYQVEGIYCERSTSPLSEQTVGTVVAGIGIRRLAVPERPDGLFPTPMGDAWADYASYRRERQTSAVFVYDASTEVSAWVSGRRNPEQAAKTALDACRDKGGDCEVYAVNGELVHGLSQAAIAEVMLAQEVRFNRVRFASWLLRVGRDASSDDGRIVISPPPDPLGTWATRMRAAVAGRLLEDFAREGLIAFDEQALVIHDLSMIEQIVDSR